MPTLLVTIVSDEDFLKAHAPGAPFLVEVDGDQTSFLGKVRCAYFEWSYGLKEAGKLVSYSVAYHSDSSLRLLAEGTRTTLPAGRVRVYADAAIEKEYQAGDESAPQVVQEKIAREKCKSVFVAEYRLEAGKYYHAVVHEDVFPLPPDGASKPRQGKRTVLRLSDKPFKDGAPQVEATPAYRHWSY
jgi:hypothetical protein